MGRTFHFECPRCQYRVRVSGGADAGVNCRVQTVLCHDCRELHDVFTRLLQRVESSEPSAQPANRRPTQRLTFGVTIPPLALIENPMRVYGPGCRPVASTIQRRWVDVKLRCPVAQYHRIEPWQHPGHCPRCGTYLEKNVFPYRLWD